MDVKELINDPGIWGGQNRPSLKMDEADVLVFSIPYDGGVAFRSGAKEAPKALREITYTIAPTTEDFESFDGLKVVDIGDVSGSNRAEMFDEAEKTAYEAVKNGKFFTMIGGDHSVTIPIQKGIDNALDEPFGIIHIDAHFDLCDELNDDKLSHGSTERRALELNNISGPENLFFIGIRSIEDDEFDFFQNNNVACVTAKSIFENGVDEAITKVKEHFKDYNKIYLTVDIDCLDPAYAPGTGTPKFGGLASRELLKLLRGIFDLPIIGMDVVEIAPSLDDSIISVFAGLRIITECWGHNMRKLGRLKSIPK